MKPNRTLALIFTLTTALLPLAGATAFSADSSAKEPFTPTVGQAGKDVIWVPTGNPLVDKMLDMVKVTPNDYVIDLGSGDGRIVIAAAKRGARALGIEYNPKMVELSKNNAEKEGVSAKATFKEADIFKTDFSDATVVTLYLLPDLNMKLRDTILKMKPGTRVVSHDFDMQDWDDDDTATFDNGTAHFWIVPAKVEGTWTFQASGGAAELALKQTFQKIEPTLKSGGKELPVKNAKLQGNKISFSVTENAGAAQEYSGVVSGNTITGTSKAGTGPEAKWTAQRRAP
jgi:SAM-dependent methyltransferase